MCNHRNRERKLYHFCYLLFVICYSRKRKEKDHFLHSNINCIMAKVNVYKWHSRKSAMEQQLFESSGLPIFRENGTTHKKKMKKHLCLQQSVLCAFE